MKFLRQVSIFFLLAILLAACQGGVSQTATVAETPVAKPETGKVTIKGKVISTITKAPLPKTDVRLADVFRKSEGSDEGAFVLNGAFSPGAVTDEQGIFVINNVDVKEYVIVIGDPYGKYKVIANEKGSARIYETQPDQVMDLGELHVDLEPIK
jgi:hypothetical protein